MCLYQSVYPSSFTKLKMLLEESQNYHLLMKKITLGKDKCLVPGPGSWAGQHGSFRLLFTHWTCSTSSAGHVTIWVCCSRVDCHYICNGQGPGPPGRVLCSAFFRLPELSISRKCSKTWWLTEDASLVLALELSQPFSVSCTGLTAAC